MRVIHRDVPVSVAHHDAKEKKAAQNGAGPGRLELADAHRNGCDKYQERCERQGAAEVNRLEAELRERGSQVIPKGRVVIGNEAVEVGVQHPLTEHRVRMKCVPGFLEVNLHREKGAPDRPDRVKQAKKRQTGDSHDATRPRNPTRRPYNSRE